MAGGGGGVLLTGGVRSSTGTAISHVLPSAATLSSRTRTSCVRICESMTVPSPSGVPTRDFFRGRFFLRSS
jgi:hypothetical protein